MCDSSELEQSHAPSDSIGDLEASRIANSNMSASQILSRSDVFHSPTFRALGRCPSPTRSYSGGTVQAGQEQAVVHAGDGEMQHHDIHEAHISKPVLNDMLKAGVYPFQRAAGLAGYLRSRSKEMRNLLASESMGYLEKVSGMWAGGQQHYGESEGIIPQDRDVDAEDKEIGCNYGDRFRAHFAQPPTEKLQATYFAFLHRVIPIYGKIYISQNKVCFRNLLLIPPRTKMVLPLSDVENVEKENGFRFGYSGLVIIVRGHEELFFEFSTAEARDDCVVTLLQHLESRRYLVGSGFPVKGEKEEADAAGTEHRMLQEARYDASTEQQQQQLHQRGRRQREPSVASSAEESSSSSEMYSIFDDTHASIVNFKPTESLRITCLTIGSRGDVQPYIALCKGLLAEGHQPKIVTHAEFGPWVKRYGIDFAPIEGDPAELMRVCVENGMFTISFLREASAKFRGWIDGLLSSAWASCQGSNVLIESPSAMAGIHIAEALQIPYFRGFTMPWTKTRAYPHAFAVPQSKWGGSYNHITYVMFDTVFWKAISGQINRWRNKELGLKSTNLKRMQQDQVPFLYNYSPSVVPRPLDYPDFIHITGYWFLNEGLDWKPPHELAYFIQRARDDGKKIVYIGFGSVVVSEPAALTETVIKSVLKADVRCILSKGWSDRLGDPSSTKTEIPLPPEIIQIQSAPHDWLFGQVDAVVHHGGAGTTGASLRVGIPTVIKPFFGDQYFWGSRVEDLGVGIYMRKLNVTVLSRALWEAVYAERIILKARALGEQIRSVSVHARIYYMSPAADRIAKQEDGVGNAIQAMYRDLEYAKTLSYRRLMASHSAKPLPKKGRSSDDDEADEGHDDDVNDDDLDDDAEWMLVGDEVDNDALTKTFQEGNAAGLSGEGR